MVAAFIQNVHHFRDDCLADEGAPPEHVVLFDEAQRAWTLEQTTNFMARKKNRPGFGQSEPEFLISCLDRHKDWAVVVCLVGGGQEINTGEAGISEWLDAVLKRFTGWDVHLSPTRRSQESSATHGDEYFANSSAMDSSGVFQPSVFLGRPLSRRAMSLSKVWLASDKSVPFGRN